MCDVLCGMVCCLCCLAVVRVGCNVFDCVLMRDLLCDVVWFVLRCVLVSVCVFCVVCPCTLCVKYPAMTNAVLCMFVFVCCLFVFVWFVCDLLCDVVWYVYVCVMCGFVCCVLLLLKPV